MASKNRRSFTSMVMSAASVVALGSTLAAQSPPIVAPPAVAPSIVAAPAVMRLTLEEAKQRALSNSKALALAAANAQGKGYAVRAARADYFPKVVGSSIYFHFDSPLGSIITTQSRPILGIPSNQVAVNVVNQDQSFTTTSVAQPITALLKIRQGVKIARADERIAKLQAERGAQAILSGVEQLYWGLLAARRIRDGASAAAQGAAALAGTGTLEARTAALEARQGLQAAESQVADVQEQLDALLDLPLCTMLELVEPPLPILPDLCADDVIGFALGHSTEIREAAENVEKARAAVAVAKVDYLPSVNFIGGYAHQQGIPAIQQNFGYLGVQGSYTFFEWGKRKNVVRERDEVVIVAQQKLAQTQDEVRAKAQKAFRESRQAGDALKDAATMVDLRKEAQRAGTPKTAASAAKARMLAEVELVKADLAFRLAHAQLMGLIGR